MISFLQYIEEEIWRTPRDKYAKGKYKGKPQDKNKKASKIIKKEKDADAAVQKKKGK